MLWALKIRMWLILKQSKYSEVFLPREFHQRYLKIHNEPVAIVFASKPQVFFA